MFWHASREKHGVRVWFHFGGDGVRRRCIGIELGWWHRFCHAGIECDDEGWNISLAFPPLFFHLSLDGFGLWQPQRKCVATWDASNPAREFWLVDRRECRVSFHDWTLFVNPWSKWGEWNTRDPWWVRGWTFNVQDVVLGRARYTCESLGAAVETNVQMPEGAYPAIFTPQRQTWKRPRWRALVRDSFDIKISKGIPFAGKGENSWDCGDDGLFGMGAEGTLDQAIEKVRATVLERRRRYGAPSEQAIAEALGQ